jgi:hypothetical protein
MNKIIAFFISRFYQLFEVFGLQKPGSGSGFYKNLDPAVLIESGSKTMLLSTAGLLKNVKMPTFTQHYSCSFTQ